MFVRTKDGKIFDCYVSEQMGKPIYYPKCSKTNGYIDWNEVYKKSENIIDILEEGDYVNGELVDVASIIYNNVITTITPKIKDIETNINIKMSFLSSSNNLFKTMKDLISIDNNIRFI